MEVLADTEMRLRDASSKKILVEVMLLKAIEARSAVSLDSVLQQLRDLRGDGGREVVSIPSSTTSNAPAPHIPKPFRAEASTAAVPTSGAGPVPVASLRESATGSSSSQKPPELLDLWKNVLEAVGRVSAFTRSYLLEAHPVSFTKNVLTIGFDPEFQEHIALVDVPRNHTLLQTKLAELGHAHVQFKFIQAEAPTGWQRPAQPVASAAAAIVAPAQKTPSTPKPAETPVPVAPAREKPAPVAFSKEDFKNDPLIQKALEIFKGQIVEVRA
jgi:DNA polymerase-3 subunit gamma/tau